MRRSGIALLVLAVLGIVAPVQADAEPTAIYHLSRGHLVQLWQQEGAAVEVNMFAGTGEVILDANEEPVEGDRACIEIFSKKWLDMACGTFDVQARPALGGTTVRAVLESTLYDYDSSTVTFTEVGPSTITIDLDLVGAGTPRRRHSEATGAGVCGLPPDTRGAFVMGQMLLERDAVPFGILHSEALGVVDPSSLTAEIMDGNSFTFGACV